MTLTNTTHTAGPYACDGEDTFTWAFPIVGVDGLEVVLRTVATGVEEVLEYGDDYRLAGANPNDPLDWSLGGIVTTTTTYPSHYEILIRRATPLTQTVKIDDEVEEALDRLTMIVQELAGRIGALESH